jgi:hypothetical protein
VAASQPSLSACGAAAPEVLASHVVLPTQIFCATPDLNNPVELLYKILPHVVLLLFTWAYFGCLSSLLLSCATGIKDPALVLILSIRINL